MTKDEHILAQTMEECGELAQRVSKALRFGMTEIQSGHVETNFDRIVGEMNDLWALLSLIKDPRQPKRSVLYYLSQTAMDAKIAKVEKYLKYAAEQGTLQETP